MITETDYFNDAPETPAVVVEDLYKAFRSGTAITPVLEGVDLTVRRGECVYLVGPSGSGKTTLMSIIGCILSSDRGRVRVLGRDVNSLDPSQRSAMRRNRIGFVFQRFHLMRGLTTLDNVTVPLTLQGVGRQDAWQRSKAMLEAVGLADKVNAHPRNLSAGQCQRVALARALVGLPELVLADEPTASLDAANGQEVMKLLLKLTISQGKTLVVVTHDPRIFDLADRICRLEDGHIVDDTQPTPVPTVAAPCCPSTEMDNRS